MLLANSVCGNDVTTYTMYIPRRSRNKPKPTPDYHPDFVHTPRRCWPNLRSQRQKAFEAFAEQIDPLEIKHPLTCQT